MSERHRSSFLFQEAGLRYNENAIASGAQTERRGEAGPGRGLLGGETSPAALLIERATALSAAAYLSSLLDSE
jgi:hypothetical protein